MSLIGKGKWDYTELEIDVLSNQPSKLKVIDAFKVQFRGHGLTFFRKITVGYRVSLKILDSSLKFPELGLESYFGLTIYFKEELMFICCKSPGYCPVEYKYLLMKFY